MEITNLLKSFLESNKDQNRNNPIPADEFFMGIAVLASYLSKDPNTQVGACITSSNGELAGVGYNEFPIDSVDHILPWSRKGKFLFVKYTYVFHAEQNAFANLIKSANGGKIYCTIFPCNECCKLIIKKGITEVIYLDNKYYDTERVIASRLMLELAKIPYRQMEFKRIRINNGCT